MTEPFDSTAAAIVAIVESLAAGTMAAADAAIALAPLLSDLAPAQWDQLSKVIQVLGRVEGQLFVTGAPADTLGAIGSTAIDMTAKLFYGPKTALGWGAGEPFVGATGPSGTITSVTTETTAVGTTADVVLGGTPEARTLHFKIPDTVASAAAYFEMMGRGDLYGIDTLGAAARFAASGREMLFAGSYHRRGLSEGDEPSDLSGWTFARTGEGTALTL